MHGVLTFYLNGKVQKINNPDPSVLLIDYLRSSEIGLTGSKKACGQGGCGACTVILSKWSEKLQCAEHIAINSCLRPIGTLAGMAITTIEGTANPQPSISPYLNSIATASRSAFSPDAVSLLPGNRFGPNLSYHADAKSQKTAATALRHGGDTKELVRVNPVAYRLVLNNGTQCGYCSPGFVMSIFEYLIHNPRATKADIQSVFDGNICRCTGYRPILTAMSTFASDWSEEDEKERMRCKASGVLENLTEGRFEIEFPEGAKQDPKPLVIEGIPRPWYTPLNTAELGRIYQQYRDRKIHLIWGNTSYGIYPNEFNSAEVIVDVSSVAEVSTHTEIINGILHVGAGVTYSNLLEFIEAEIDRDDTVNHDGLQAIRYMARRTAGRIVRNTATVAGNTMLVLKHLQPEHAPPFISDLFTILLTLDATLTYCEIARDGYLICRSSTLADMVTKATWDPTFVERVIIYSFRMRIQETDQIVTAHKVALREVNAHSIVNCGVHFIVTNAGVVSRPILCFAGFLAHAARAVKTEALLEAEPLSYGRLPELIGALEEELSCLLREYSGHRDQLSCDGITDCYRVQLASALFYKSLVHALTRRDFYLPGCIRSSASSKWGNWPPSRGRQFYASNLALEPVGEPYIKREAIQQAFGQTLYTGDLPVAKQTVYAGVVQSRRALANFEFQLPVDPKDVDLGLPLAVNLFDLKDRLANLFPEFVDLITHADIPPAGSNGHGVGADQPLFAAGHVLYAGQCLALVLATNEHAAICLAEFIGSRCIRYTPIDWSSEWREPILDLDTAITKESVFPDYPMSAPTYAHIWKITRPGSRFEWVAARHPSEKQSVTRSTTVDGTRCIIVEGSLTTGSQAHFYMEPQSCIVDPSDEWRLTVRCATQSPREMHQTIATALGLEYHRIDVQVPPVGGGFGGKTEQTRFVVGPAAVAAWTARRPVRLVLPRETDTTLIGRRHAYYGQYQVAVDSGETDGSEKGRIHGIHIKSWADGGAYYDCSFIVADSAQLRSDNAYYVRHFESQVDVCRTNTAPSTAYRGFGTIQSVSILENAIDDAAAALRISAEEMRELNLYRRGESTPYGQSLTHCYMREVWDFLKEKCNFKKKQEEVTHFNQHNRWVKRGLSMIPVKYGAGYNLAMLEQAAAFVVVNYGDGSVLVHHGGVEMGQGLKTQVQQVAASILNIPLDLIYLSTPTTAVIPNPTTTGASSGTTLTAHAVKESCTELRSRITEFGHTMLSEHGPAWCIERGIDFWNYGTLGWAAYPERATAVDSALKPAKAKLIWQNLIELAYANRVNLLCCGTAKVNPVPMPLPCRTYKGMANQPELPGITTLKEGSVKVDGQIELFTGFTYSAACSVVEVDVLTGEVKLISTDIAYDKGWSLNPAIDIGQVEGAFIQGVGYLVTEHLVYESRGAERGRLNTSNTWHYKPPASCTIPLELNVHLFPRDSVSMPKDANEFLNTKEVGEPPLVLATTVFFAIKAAVRATRTERGLSALFRLDAPATVQEVRRACDVSACHFAFNA